jgi:hypothetical protein
MKLGGRCATNRSQRLGALPEPARRTADRIELGPLIAASGTRGLALLRLDRLADAKEEAIRAQDAQLIVHWPNWLPR